mmetsp:Transcript_95949/g.277085  ORF Transcript_95949/g.277085 Transcript_95949/m.277085 type:complete len:270 (+) Transcript_95949:1000-1809(+)
MQKVGKAIPRRVRHRVPGTTGGSEAAGVAQVVAQQGAKQEQGAVLELARSQGPVLAGDDRESGKVLQRLPRAGGLLRLLQHGWPCHRPAQYVPHEELYGGHHAVRQLPGRCGLDGRHLRSARRRLLWRGRHRRPAYQPVEEVGHRADRAAGGAVVRPRRRLTARRQRPGRHGLCRSSCNASRGRPPKRGGPARLRGDVERSASAGGAESRHCRRRRRGEGGLAVASGDGWPCSGTTLVEATQLARDTGGSSLEATVAAPSQCTLPGYKE